jgi:hypothetical protein
MPGEVKGSIPRIAVATQGHPLNLSAREIDDLEWEVSGDAFLLAGGRPRTLGPSERAERWARQMARHAVLWLEPHLPRIPTLAMFRATQNNRAPAEIPLTPTEDHSQMAFATQLSAIGVPVGPSNPIFYRQNASRS